MPLPERYKGEVLDVVRIWEPEGTFRSQTRVWEALCEARHELEGKPNVQQLANIRRALVLAPEDITDLTVARGHETNKLLRKVQSRLSPEEGNFIHLGCTSSDILDTSLALQIIESLDICEGDFAELSENLLKLAIKHKNTLQIARTHGQHAIPTTFGRQSLGWHSNIEMCMPFFDQAREMISSGKCSGEVGTNVFIDPKIEDLALNKLGLSPEPAPTQVISRIRHGYVASLMSLNGAALEKIFTDIRLLATTDIGEVREPFDAKEQQGSSAMPHKRNPELSERICGIAKLIRTDALAQIETVPLWLERDISHSSVERTTFPDIFGNLAYATRVANRVTSGLVVNKDRMAENLNRTNGAIYSSRLLNELVGKGFARTEAYELVKGLAQRALDTGAHLSQLAAEDQRVSKSLTLRQLKAVFNPKFYLKNIKVAYERLGVDI